MAEFEVAVYNKEVRQKVALGEHHNRFTDDWADIHYLRIEADDDQDVRSKIDVLHPGDQGFVIENIQKIEGGVQEGTERGDERRQEQEDVSDDRRKDDDRRTTVFSMKLSTSASLVELEDMLDEECADDWNMIFLGMDDEFFKKNVQIMFVSEIDKNNFIENHLKSKK